MLSFERFAYNVSRGELKLPQDFIEAASRLLPDDSYIPEHPHENLYKITPLTIAELLPHKENYQRGIAIIGRSEEVDKMYQEAIKKPGYSDSTKIRPTRMNGQQIFISQNQYPFNVGTRIIHNVLWYLNEVSEEERNRYFAGWLWAKDIPLDKVIAKRNPIFSQSVREIKHYHILHELPNEVSLPDCA